MTDLPISSATHPPAGVPSPGHAPIPTVVDPDGPLPKPAKADPRNTWSERLLGKDHRFAFGVEGEVRLPKLSRDELHLDARSIDRLAHTRVYLLPGTPWPGAAKEGTAWLEPWARLLEEAGVSRAVPIRYTESSAMVSNLKMLAEPFTHQQRDAALAGIEADLRDHPLQPGDRLFLVGHSYGSRLGGEVASALVERGAPVAGYVAIEDRVSPVGQILTQAPAVPRVLEVENDPGKPLQTRPGTSYRRLVMPRLSHMDMVMDPPKSLLTALLTEFSQ